MRNPVAILNTLKRNSIKSNYKFRRLHRLLYNEEFFLLAYNNIYSSQGNMTAGSDGKTIDQMSLERIQTLIQSIKNHKYQPQSVRRKYIPKKNGKMRPLGIPSIEDKLAQEVIRLILETIWEDAFSKNSHGFRQGRGCHTALMNIKETFGGVKWFVEGDIKGFFDNIDHSIMVSILKSKIEDEYFVQLIMKYLKAGYMEEGRRHISYSGTAQGSLISPILANIYLNEFDKYVSTYIQKFNKGTRRKRNPEYHRIDARKQYWIKKLRKLEKGTSRYIKVSVEIKRYSRLLLSTPASEPMDNEFRRMYYIRYADDFLVGIIGAKIDAIQAKEDFKIFMGNNLKLELSGEKTLITHSAKRIRFLGYDITIKRNNTPRKNKNGKLSRCYNSCVKLYMPKEVWLSKLLSLKAMHIVQATVAHKEQWLPNSWNKRINNNEENIIKQYNDEIRGLYNYYKIACNVSYAMHKFRYFMYYSCIRTLAKKHRIRMKAARIKFDKDGHLMVENTSFYSEGFHTLKTVPVDYYHDIDIHAKYRYPFGKYSPARRILYGICELCGARNVRIIMHHVRSMKNIKPDTEWNAYMLKVHRKSIALCDHCNGIVHSSF